MKTSGIGGQAVLEGIMMRNGDDYSVAVRKSDGGIASTKDQYKGIAAKSPLRKIPFVRGTFAMIDSLVLGMKSLTFSANQFAEEDGEQEEPGRFEKWLMDKFGDKAESVIMNITMGISIVLAVLIFAVLPTVLSNFVKRFLGNGFWTALFEGLLRMGIFIGYISLVSLMKDIRRTYMYHGAEHKCINCIEHGLELNVENVMKSSKEHKRCGTSFLLFIMTVSILLFLVIRPENLGIKILSRILLIPVIAGISYEILRMAGTTDNKFIDIISRPGLLLQKLTTKEPDAQMAEVAIHAVEEVFDWRAYLKENFPEKYSA